MSVTIRAHFDGRVIVPDEPVPAEVPINVPLIATLTLIDHEETDAGTDPATDIRDRQFEPE